MAETITALLATGADFIAVAAALYALWVAWSTRQGRSGLVESVLRRSRLRVLAPICRDLGVRRSTLRRECAKHSRAISRFILEQDAETELLWLSSLAGKNRTDLKAPLVVHGFARDPWEAEVKARNLHAVAGAYEELHKRLTAQTFLSGNALVKSQSVLAREVAQYLRQAGHYAARETECAGQTEALQFEYSKRRFEWLWVALDPLAHVTIDDLDTVHTRIRRIADYEESEFLAEQDLNQYKYSDLQVEKSELTDDERRFLKGHFASGKFDGVLPSLANSYRQIDPTSGRARLLLDLHEMSFSCVLLEHFVDKDGVGRTRKTLETLAESHQTYGVPRLLTLSLLPISADGRILFTKRSDHVATGGLGIGPAVTGNLELRNRLGTEVDTDQFGFPSPLRALSRESFTELHLEVPVETIQVDGLCRFTDDLEVQTWVLLTHAFCTLSASEIVQQTRFADPAEGIWEHSGEFLSIPVPTNCEELKRTIIWLMQNDEVLSVAFAAFIAFMMKMPAYKECMMTPRADEPCRNEGTNVNQVKEWLESLRRESQGETIELAVQHHKRGL